MNVPLLPWIHGKGHNARRFGRIRSGKRDGIGIPHQFGRGLHSGIDFQQFNAHTIDLDLVIVSTEVLKLAIP